MSLRSIKAKARLDLHQAMKVPAYYYATRAADPVAVDIRVHTSFKALGDLKGTSFSYAETEADVPELIFWLADLTPANNSLVMISATEGYRVNHTVPPDGLTITAKVASLSAADRAGLSYPGA